MSAARRVLATNKYPTLPSSTGHVYTDKYVLSETLANMSLAAVLNALELLGVNVKTLKTVREWARERSVTLRLKAEETCDFDRETKREVESSAYVRDYGVGKITDKVVTTITEWFWRFSVDYSLFIFCGNDPEDKVVLQTRVGKMELMTTTKDAPRPQVVVRDPVDLNLSYLLSHINADGQFAFKINRDAEKCRTPRRNPDTHAMLQFVTRMATFGNGVVSYLRDNIFAVQTNQGGHQAVQHMLSQLHVNSVFVPVVPLFESSRADQHDSNVLVPLSRPADSKVIMSLADLNRFLDEQKRTLSELFVKFSKLFPDGVKLITVAEANIIALGLHLASIATHYIDGVNFIENLLRQQLVAAIGRELTAVDFQNYMLFHNRRIFREEYQPRAFCYAVRRPDHYPEGIVSIEGQLLDGTAAQPIHTIVSRNVPASPMHFSISASAKVAFRGEVFLHGYVGHSFAGETGIRLNLNARARQFSSFLVLVGRISGPGLFDPQFGMICQNKDEFELPLELETIPTPKEFKDAIESLSPEQQQFAKLFRGMQLASTLFGVCVLQIKPQLERVLKLNNEALTKEIRLTQDLLDLFLQYQIPSDLLSFGGAPEASGDSKLQGVKRNVQAMQAMIDAAKQKEIDDAALEAQMRLQEQIARAPQMPMPVSAPSRYSTLFCHVDVFFHSNFSRPLAPLSISSSSSVKKSRQVESAPRAYESSAAPLSAPAPSPVAASVSAPSPMAAPVEPAKPAATEAAATEAAATTATEAAATTASTKFECGETSTADVDFTKLPGELDSKFEKYDPDAALRPTILNVGKQWNKRSQRTLLSPVTAAGLDVAAQKLERNTCFDLLDALTNSGCIGFEGATLHIVMASTHCFADNLMNTLVKDNINPIEKLERSELIVATTIHRRKADDMLVLPEAERAKLYSPNVFLLENGAQ